MAFRLTFRVKGKVLRKYPTFPDCWVKAPNIAHATTFALYGSISIISSIHMRISTLVGLVLVLAWS